MDVKHEKTGKIRIPFAFCPVEGCQLHSVQKNRPRSLVKFLVSLHLKAGHNNRV